MNPIFFPHIYSYLITNNMQMQEILDFFYLLEIFWIKNCHDRQNEKKEYYHYYQAQTHAYGVACEA
jgi:hypothetical protein